MLISFVLPAYKSKFLREAIDSILAQTYSDIEIIIIDDNSPENLYDIVSTYKDPRISYYKNEVNIGGKDLVAQWNKSIDYAKGEYLVLAADDDIYHPEFSSECISLIKKYPEVDILRARVSVINDSGELLEIDGILAENCSQMEFVNNWVKGIAFVCIGNYMFKTRVIQNERFDHLPFAFCTDIISTVKLAKNGIANTSQLLFDFRVSDIHLSSDKTKYEHKIKAITQLYKMLQTIDYNQPKNDVEKLCLKKIQWDTLYQKCVYDYYNVAIKNLPINKVGCIENCELLSRKDKMIMYIRFFIDKLFK